MTDEDWRGGVLSRLSQVESRLGQVEMKNAVDEVHRKNVEQRLANIESGQTWLLRLVLGGIIAAAVVFVINGGLAG